MKRSEAIAYLEVFNPDSLITTTKKGKNTIRIADAIMQNKFYLLDGLDVIHFNETIDWNYTHPESANTYRLYLQCLNVLSHLVDAYRMTKEKKYLVKAKEILWDWIDYILHDNSKNTYKWADHSVSNRVLNIIYLYTIAHEVIKLDEEKIIPILIKHGEFLEDDKHYRPNNHGIMVDRSLIYLSAFLKNYKASERWYQKARYRIINAIYRDFSIKGVHLENSPAYHAMTRRIYRDLEYSLKSINMSLGTEVEEMLEKSTRYIRLIMKPNNELPMLGDTQKNKINGFEKLYDSFQDSHAGITILQHKDKLPGLSTWLAFVCGYGSPTHKHRDDLSFSLFHKGEDIFIDSGRYNYDKNDKIRKYLLSPKSHTTFTISDEDYEIRSAYEYRDIIKTTDFYSNKEYSYVRGINKAYEGSSLSRSILFLKPDIIVIKDFGRSNQYKEFEQIFNLAPTISIESNDSENSICLIGKKNKINIRQLLNSDPPLIVNGDESIPRAVISEKFGKLTHNRQLIYKASGKEVEIITIINLNQQENDDLRINYSQTNGRLSVQYREQSFSLII